MTDDGRRLVTIVITEDPKKFEVRGPSGSSTGVWDGTLDEVKSYIEEVFDAAAQENQ